MKLNGVPPPSSDDACNESNDGVLKEITTLPNTPEDQGIPTRQAEGKTSTGSISSTVCRICQLTEKESGLPMARTGCRCQGSLSACHRTCLQRWVDSRVNDICEICNQDFGIRVSPEMLTAESEPMITLMEPGQAVTCADSRRTWFLIIFFLLFFATAAAVALSAYTNQDYLAQQMQFWNATVDLATVQKFRFVYGLSISILVFCSCMCLSVGLVWAFAEMYLWPQERSIMRRQHMFELARMAVDGTVVGMAPNGNAALGLTAEGTGILTGGPMADDIGAANLQVTNINHVANPVQRFC